MSMQMLCPDFLVTSVLAEPPGAKCTTGLGVTSSTVELTPREEPDELNKCSVHSHKCREVRVKELQSLDLFSSLQVTRHTNYCTKLLFSSVVSLPAQLKQLRKFYVYLSRSS